MNLFGLLAHLSLLIHCGKDVASIVENLVQHKENFPSAAEFSELIADAIALVGSGMFSFPADVQQNMIAALTELKNEVESGSQPSPAPASSPAPVSPTPAPAH